MSTAEETTALAVVEPREVQQVFSTPGALNPLLEKVAKEVRSFRADVSTAAGRQEIASMAYKVARTKTYLDSMGKELVDRLKDLPRKVDANRKSMRDFLDGLRDEVRAPLDAWETEEERKKQAEAARIAAEALAKEIEAAHEIALLMNADFDRQREEKRRAEEQRRKESEERIAREAAERARREAEDKAMRREVEARLAQEKAEREKADAERRAKEAEERAEQERRQADEREERARKEAIEQERKRREEEERKAKTERAAREADLEHRRQIDAEAKESLMALGFTESGAGKMVAAIAAGKVRHVTVNY